MNSVNYQQGFYKSKDGVYCSKLINPGPFPSFKKIVHDYVTELPKAIEVCFDHRNYDFAIYQYLKFGFFRQSVKNKDNGRYDVSLTFLSPRRWSDPCESVFYQPDIRIADARYRILCMCTTLDPTESEESAWNRVARKSMTDEKTIRIAYNFDAFCVLLSKMATKNAMSFYLSMADYSKSREYFRAATANTYTTLEDYLNELSRKRKAFAYENEMRIFAVQQLPDDTPAEVNDVQDKLTLTVELQEDELKDLLHSLSLPPYPPFPNNDPRAFYYSQIQDYDNFDLRIGAMNVYHGLTIRQSRLYDLNKDTSYVKSIVKTYQSRPKQ